MVKVKDIIEKIKKLEEEKNNYNEALSKLRSKANWEPGIEQDGREAIKTIYGLYSKTKSKIEELMNTEVK